MSDQPLAILKQIGGTIKPREVLPVKLDKAYGFTVENTDETTTLYVETGKNKDRVAAIVPGASRTYGGNGNRILANEEIYLHTDTAQAACAFLVIIESATT